MGAFQRGNEIWLRKTSPDLASEGVHEGVHCLQEFGEIPSGNSVAEKEYYAYFFQREFEEASGRELEFRTLKEMLEFIVKEYSETDGQ